MGSWTSLVVLVLAVASTLSFPRPEDSYQIPIVGQGRRSQYYVLHSDGTYKYGYDTLGGAYEQAMAKTPGYLSGEFGYKDPAGADIKLEYTADDRGFIARGSHLPVPPDVPVVALIPAAHEPASPAAPSVYKAPETVPQPAAPSVYETAEIVSSSAGDGSYSFSYKTSDSSRSESGDANNAVSGTYSYITDDGVDHQTQYKASADTGYVVTGDSLPVGPAVPGAESGIPTGHILPVLSEEEANALAGAVYTAGVPESPVVIYSADESPSDASYSFSYDAGESSRSESADSNLNIKGTYSFIPPDLDQKLTVNYIAGSETGFVAKGDHLPKAEDADFGTKLTAAHEVESAAAGSPEPAGSVQTYSAGESPSDASYSFSYDAGDSFRSETSDSNLNIEGSYSFVPPDSNNRFSVKYVAGADTGFVAKGDHLPVPPDVPVVALIPAAHEPASPAAPSVYKAPETVPQPAAPSVYETAEIVSSSAGDGSYSFSYKTSDSSRSESGDANNAVSGTYSYITDDGVDHQTQYKASADTGYVVTGDSLPVGPAVPGAESGIPTGHILPVLSEEEANALAGAVYTAGVPESPVVIYSADESPSDASYSFSYDAGESSRSESADSNLNIKGTYSFIPPDLDQKLTVNYIAGSETGFVAKGDHLPKAEDAGFGTKLTAAHEVESAAAGSPEPAGSVQTYSAGESPSDASYSFSYDAGDSFRSETSDSNLNIEGSYSFVPPDSNNRFSVKYVAGADTGFVAKGDHLPVPPDVPVVALIPAAHEPASPAAPSVYKAPEPAPQETPITDQLDLRTHYTASADTASPVVPEAADVPAVIAAVEAQSAHQPVGYSSHVVGNVLLRQYGVEYPDKYGYVFTALHD